MRIAVIGAGVVGVNTAYCLARDGHSVTVFERQPSAAMEGSFANGGQLSFGFASPMAAPALLSRSPAILCGRDSAFDLSPGFLLREPLWMLKFAKACLPKPYAHFSQELNKIAKEAKRALDQICTETHISFSRRKAGKLILYSNEKAFSQARISFSNREDTVEKNRSECLALDPALAAIGGALSGGLWFENDEVGDVEQFCLNLATLCTERFTTQFRFGTSVTTVDKQSNGAFALSLSNDERFSCDLVVICTGVAGVKLLKQHGIKLPIIAVEGYSITAPPGSNPPSVAITDADHKIVCSRIGSYTRIAGFADFGERDDFKRDKRIKQLIAVAQQRFPEAADFNNLHSTWSGLRPATPTSLPIVGETRVPGIYVNMGHGMYGWTLASATARRLSKQLSSRAQCESPARIQETL